MKKTFYFLFLLSLFIGFNLATVKTEAVTINAANQNSKSSEDAAETLGENSTGDAEIDAFIVKSCKRYKIDPLLIFAQMTQESAFKLNATSHKGASGLMQLMPATAARFGVKNIYDPQQNIEAGVKYMRWLLDKFDGDVRLALAAYNAGEGSVLKYGNQIPPYGETQNYVARITTHYEKIRISNSIPNLPVIKSINQEIAKNF